MSMYLFLKWLHIVAVISWMAGVLYLYRLLVYHRETSSTDNRRLLQTMERRLYYFITLPAMKIAFIAGLGIVGTNHAIAQTGWFIAKFIFALLLIGATIYAGVLMKRATSNHECLPNGRILRAINEIPTVLMLIIVWLVVFKPF